MAKTWQFHQIWKDMSHMSHLWDTPSTCAAPCKQLFYCFFIIFLDYFWHYQGQISQKIGHGIEKKIIWPIWPLSKLGGDLMARSIAFEGIIRGPSANTARWWIQQFFHGVTWAHTIKVRWTTGASVSCQLHSISLGTRLWLHGCLETITTSLSLAKCDWCDGISMFCAPKTPFGNYYMMSPRVSPVFPTNLRKLNSSSTTFSGKSTQFSV